MRSFHDTFLRPDDWPPAESEQLEPETAIEITPSLIWVVGMGLVVLGICLGIPMGMAIHG